MIGRTCAVVAGEEEIHAKFLMEKLHGNRPCRKSVYRHYNGLQINHVMESDRPS